MKLNKRKLVKSLLIFVGVIFSILIMSSLALYNDTSRNFILNRIICFLQSDNFSLKIEGVNKELSYVDKIKVRFSNFSVNVSHLNLKRKKSIFYPQLKAEKVVFKALHGEKNSFSGFDLNKIPSVLKKMRFFIRNLKISKAVLKIGSEEHICEDVTYQSKKYQDIISAKIKQSDINIVIDRANSYRVNGDFKNIFGYSVNFKVDSLKKSKLGYQLIVKNFEQELIAQGSIIDKGKVFSISKASLKHKNIELNFCGKILLDNKQVNLSTELSLADFIDTQKIPSEIVKNFTNISANLVIEKKGEEFDTKINFERDQRKIGDSRIKFKDKFLSMQLYVPWIDLWGYKINNLNIKSDDLKKFAVEVVGQNFKGSSEIIHDKEILVKSLVFDVEKGKFSLKKAFFMNDLDPSFEFSFESLNFFKKLWELDGNVAGELAFSNKKCWVNAKINRIIHKNCELYAGKIFGDLNDLKIDIADMRCFGNTLKNLIFTKKNHDLNFKAKLNGKSDVILNGNYSNNVLKISGNVKNNLLKIRDISVDFIKKLYNISFEVSDKNKSGKFLLSISPDKIDSTIENLPVRGIGKIFNKVFPTCFVNGNFSWTPNRNLFFGDGHLKVDGLISKRSSFDIELKQDQKGLYIQGDLANSIDHLQFSALIPIFVNRNLGYSIKRDSPLAMIAKGEIYIENFFEFPDGVNVRGKIKSDFSVGGSLASPEVNGSLEYTKAAIIVSDVVLRNGEIKLRGQKNKFLVDSASFTDFRGKKAKITGDIALSFSDDIINLDSDLILNFDRFCLFNTDDTKIYVTGTGRMSGSLNDMKLSGNLKIPLCELTFSETDNTSKYEDIQFVNDRFLKKSKNQKNDFFLYDVGLECPRIKIIGDIYDLEFGGNLHLGSYKQKAALSGNIELGKGKLSLFGKRMIFEKSRVEFFENHPFDPKMSLICSKNLDNMKIFLRITNTPGNGISTDLYSKPHYTQDIILSQMMFGKSSRDLSVGEAAQLAHALNSLEQKGYIFSILNTFQNLGLVDSISFSTENNSSSLYKNSQTSSNNQINVKAGKYLSDNVYISVNQKEKETSFDVDLSIGSNASLKVNTQGEVGINWKFRY